MLTIPPEYSASTPVPQYSSEPSQDEQRLESTPRIGTRARPTSVFTHKARGISVILHDQEDGAAIPSFGRNSAVSGEVCLERCENVLSVSLKVSPTTRPPLARY